MDIDTWGADLRRRRNAHRLFIDDPDGRARFRQALGAHPEDYRDQRLVDSAIHLVCRSDLPVAEIAGGLGFTEPELFTKWFRSRTREAPTKMRAAARESAGPEAAPEAPRPSLVHFTGATHRHGRPAVVSPRRRTPIAVGVHSRASNPRRSPSTRRTSRRRRRGQGPGLADPNGSEPQGG